jgi:hypothetical protein
VFRVVTDLECHKALRLQYCVSVVVLKRDNDEDAATSVLEEIARQLRATDLVASLSPSEVGLLLIDAETADVARIVERVANELPDSWRPSVQKVGVACFPITVSRGSELLQRAAQAGDRQQAPLR